MQEPGLKNPVRATSCGFESHLRHIHKFLQTSTIFTSNEAFCSAMPIASAPATKRRGDSDLQPRLLKVELAQDPVHHLV
jgi:hypothetical protein